LKKVIIDTNILFSALLGKSKYIREAILSDNEVTFYSCKFVFVELFKYKDKIQSKSSLEEDEILELLHALLSKIKIFNEETVTDESLNKAYSLCKDVDEKDTPFVAITIELSGFLWTKDIKLKEGLKSKGFDSFFDIE
jgi:putative PIN family toxin of toxin-antitoxin system